MIIEVSARQTKSGNVKITNVRLQCDGCCKQYNSKRRSRDINRDTHWCSRKCIGVGLRFNGQIRKRVEQTNIERWGVPYAQQHPDVEAKRKTTCIERYDHISPMQVDKFKEQRRSNTVQKHGVSNTSKLTSTIQKMHVTNMTRYGAKSPLKNPKIYAKVDWQAMIRKNHEAMKRNGTYRTSKAEEHFYKLLIKQFGIDNVERQTKPKNTNWPIDFYVKPIDTWVQIDGVYWHGLDRSIQEHIDSGCPRSNSIIGKWHVDRKQERWFIEQGMHLFRITDLTIGDLVELPSDLAEIAYFSS